VQTVTNDPNPDNKISPYPMHRIAAIVDDEPAVQTALGELARIGIDRSEVDVLAGESGAELMDPTGERHGVFGRLLRLLQMTAEEGNALEAHNQALLSGKHVIYVNAKGEKDKDEVASALTAAGGHHLAYFGRWVVEKQK
jgi:hypothetical protein